MGTVAEEQYHLRWNDYHSSLTKCFRDLRDNDEMLDVIIISDGRTFKAHKLVLSACSPMFKAMLKKARGQPFLQPIVFLHGVRHEDIEAILDFMYNGEVSVNQEDLRSFLTVAEDLRVRGLTQMDLEKKTEDIPSEDERSRSPEVTMRSPEVTVASAVARTNYLTDNEIRRQQNQQKRRRSMDDMDEPVLQHKRELLGNMMSSTPLARESLREYSIDHGSAHSSPYHQGFPGSSPPNLGRRVSNSMEPHGNVSFHRLGGRDHGDPLSNVMVTRSDKGWHCPECIHIATTKGNLKSHILSGRHKLSEKSFKCRFCDRSYSTRQSMQVHISTNHRQERDLEMNISNKDLNMSGGDILPLPGDPVVMDFGNPNAEPPQQHINPRFAQDDPMRSPIRSRSPIHGPHGSPRRNQSSPIRPPGSPIRPHVSPIRHSSPIRSHGSPPIRPPQHGGELGRAPVRPPQHGGELGRSPIRPPQHGGELETSQNQYDYPPSHSEEETTPPHLNSAPHVPNNLLVPAPNGPNGPHGPPLNSHVSYSTTEPLPSANAAYEDSLN